MRHAAPGRLEKLEISAFGSTEPTSSSTGPLLRSQATFAVCVVPELPAARTKTVLCFTLGERALKTDSQSGFSVQPATPSDMLMTLAPAPLRALMPFLASSNPAVLVLSNGL